MRKSLTLQKQKKKERSIMALEIRSIPVLTGNTAKRFVEEAEERGKKGERVSFPDEYMLALESISERSRKFEEENNGKKIVFE